VGRGADMTYLLALWAAAAFALALAELTGRFD